MILDDTIEILTRQMLEECFVKNNNEKYVITIDELYRFCIKLVKIIKENC